MAHITSDEDMAEALAASIAGGHATLLSVRCPGKEGPNEDGAALLPAGNGRGVLAVADGMGGRPAGATAAAIALGCLHESVEGAAEDEASLRAAILDGLEQANRRILDLGIGAGTTLAVVELVDGHLRPFHVGDAGILVVGQRGKLKLQTVMHSPVGYAYEAGVLDEQEALHHEERHLVSNMVGAPDMRIEVGSARRLAARDTVLLASDGLFDNLSLGEIVEVVRAGPLERASAELARLCAGRMSAPRAGEPSKPDDLTFVLFRR
jgi:serine/threonine protein phosphatase PrpC